MLDATRRTPKEIPPQESTWSMKRIVRFFPKLSGHPLTQKQACRRIPSGRNREQLDATEEQWTELILLILLAIEHKEDCLLECYVVNR